LNHFYENIQGWFSYADIYSNAIREATSKAHFVEVGAWKGRSSAYMAVEIINSGKDIKFDVVDTWKGSDEDAHKNDLYVQSDSLYDLFISNLKPVEKYYTPKRMTSIEASKLYEDNSLDFVLLDASHTYEDVKADILAWLPKVKNGAILAGDDYLTVWPGVIHAVQELIPTRTIQGCSWIYRK
jgi:hypothetical protein